MSEHRIVEFMPIYSPKQTEALLALRDPSVDELLYGGAKGGGKSVFGCYFVYDFALRLILKYKLQPSSHPLLMGFIGRKQAKDFKQTTLETWRRFIPVDGYTLKGDPPTIAILDAVKIETGGLDRQEQINKFNSAELAVFFVDQAEETEQDDISVLRAATHNRLIIKGEIQSGKGLFTANPAPQCWLKKDFITNPPANHRFIKALPSDNPYLDESYIRTLEQAFAHRPEVLRAYRDGDWSAMAGVDTVIRSEWIDNALHRTLHYSQPRELLVCDVARFGDDETVIYHLLETEIVGQEIYGKKDTYFTANLLHKMSYDAGGIPIVVDEDGVGGGVVDNLRGMGCEVHGIVSASASDEPERYYNVRAQMWWEVGNRFSDGDISLHHEDDVLRDQLTAPRYKWRGGKLLIQAKDEIKEHLGRSPDRADAYVMGIYGLKWGKMPKSERVGPDRYMRRPKHQTAMAG